MYWIFFAISLIASVVGGICGVGGGVIIKPVLDSTGLLSVSVISFLSSCTVLSMSIVSFFRNRKDKGILSPAVSLPLAVGAVVGGIIGKSCFNLLSTMFSSENNVGAAQAGVLLVITVGSLLYSIFASKIPTKQVKNYLLCALIGLALGMLSSFLGIGGGPINLTVLFFFFSMDTKKAAANSLYIIMFSQLASLVQSLVTRTVPSIDLFLLGIMVAAGVIGGLLGGKINKKISDKNVNGLFVGFMIVVICITGYNLLRFTGVIPQS